MSILNKSAPHIFGESPKRGKVKRAMGYMPIAEAGRASCPGLDTALNSVG
ncbi:MAG: hypothetical protein ACUX7D_05365 [Candidatus Methanodesulfokora washburnensis]